jgi:hypothetical protein
MAAQSCASCGKVLPPGSGFCTQCGSKVVTAAAPPTPPPPTPSASVSPPTTAPPSPSLPLPSAQAAVGVRPRTCVNCKTQMAGMGQVSFRTGGYTGGAGLVAGSWNSAIENLQPFSLYYCQRCGKFDLYYAGT